MDSGRRDFVKLRFKCRNKRVTKTSEGDFELTEGDVLVVPNEITMKTTAMAQPRVWSFIHEDQCRSPKPIPSKESVIPNKQCTLLKPTTVLDKVEEGGSGGKHFELVENADIMIETTTGRMPRESITGVSGKTKSRSNCPAGARP